MTAPIVEAGGLSHIALRVTDVERSIAYYQAVLGYEVLTNGHSPTPDRTRNAIGLIASGGLALELLETPGGRRYAVDHLGIAGLSLSVPDIAAAVAALNASGYAEGVRVFDAEDWKVAFLFDPDGNVIELVQQPPGAVSMADFAPEMRRRRDAAR